MVELLIVTAIVLWSALYVFKSVFPKTAFKVRGYLAQYCLRLGFNRLVAKLQPMPVGGCGGGCGCSSSDAPTPKPEPVQAVKWK